MSEKELGKGIKEIDNGNLLVETKEGIFELEDPEFDKLDRARKRSNGDSKSLLSCLIVGKDGEKRSFGELEIAKLKSSTVTKLSIAAGKLLDPEGVSKEDFLSDMNN